MLLSKSSPYKPLFIAGIAGIVLWFLIPTVSNALDVSNEGALANGLFLIQTAVGFAGIIALVAAARAWRSARVTRRQTT